MKEKLKDARPKNKTLEKKFLRKEVDISKLRTEIQSLLCRPRNKKGRINMLRFASPFVLPIRKRSVTNTETLLFTEASSQTETKDNEHGTTTPDHL